MAKKYFLSAVVPFLFLTPQVMVGTTVPGYTQTVLVSGLGGALGTGPDFPRNPGPAGMAITPDGRVLIANTNGIVRVVQNGALMPTPALTLPVLLSTTTDRGLVSISVDPNFSSNGYVYLYYQNPGPGGTTFNNRLSRFTMTGNTLVPASETVIKELPTESTAASIFHMGGGIAFGADGKIYLGIGDQSLSAAANISQNMGSYFGKVLKLNPDGSTPADNPYVSTPGVLPEIFAYGFRNPFSMMAQPGTNRIMVNDVGEATWEEIDDLIAQGNYGWNQCEGPCASPGVINPLISYGHDYSLPYCSGAIVGGTFSVSLASGFSPNSYFTGDYCKGIIQSVNLTGSPSATALASNLGFIVATAPSPNGGLYYLTRSYSGELGLIEPVPEPASGIVTGFGLLGLFVITRRRAKTPRCGVERADNKIQHS